MAGKRIAILAEDLYEDVELWYPYYRLLEAGADVKIVGSGRAESFKSKHRYRLSRTSPSTKPAQPTRRGDHPRAATRQT